LRDTKTGDRGSDVFIRDPDGVEVLELGDNALVDGYAAVGYDEGSRSWRRITTYAARVNGEFDVATALGRSTLTLTVFIAGSDWSTIRTKHRALLAGVEVKDWLLDVDGSVVWRCEVADSTSPTPGLAFNSEGRFVTLTIPAQPTLGI
jgi:hypothetical protein